MLKLKVANCPRYVESCGEEVTAVELENTVTSRGKYDSAPVLWAYFPVIIG